MYTPPPLLQRPIGLLLIQKKLLISRKFKYYYTRETENYVLYRGDKTEEMSVIGHISEIILQLEWCLEIFHSW